MKSEDYLGISNPHRVHKCRKGTMDHQFEPTVKKESFFEYNYI